MIGELLADAHPSYDSSAGASISVTGGGIVNVEHKPSGSAIYELSSSSSGTATGECHSATCQAAQLNLSLAGCGDSQIVSGRSKERRAGARLTLLFHHRGRNGASTARPVSTTVALSWPMRTSKATSTPSQAMW